MIQEASEFQGERVTFRGLFEKYPIVEIPIIQRDYAQGRESAFEVRKEFLNALHGALGKDEGDPTLPLDLDFVYGSVDGTKQGAFLPLDGQQRLTTLFLLHWYLAWKDNKWDDFISFIRIKDERKSRFSYAVRRSSEKFFDFLTNYVPDSSRSKGVRLSDVIADQPHFFRTWKLDPTVQSALKMLDSIDDQFGGEQGFYDRLVQSQCPYITFQLLNLKSFGLSDELYIKMNARGKALTAFETFKAKLEQQPDALFQINTLLPRGQNASMKAYFSRQIDTVWADLFWNYLDPNTPLFNEKIMHLFDEKIMNLVRVLAIVTRNPDHDKTTAALEALRDKDTHFSFFKYDELGIIDQNLVEALIVLLDMWHGGNKEIRTLLKDTAYYDERGIFRQVINDATEVTYAALVQFHAYCAYILKNRHNLQPDAFWEWMRVIKNLAENTSYDKLDAFTRSIRSVNKLLQQASRILHYLSEPDAEVQGFDGQQIREERLKAQLILKNEAWRSLILNGEQHVYFNGQIEFLFKFCGVLDRWVGNYSSHWSAEDDAGYRQVFSDYFAKVSAVFSPAGLNDFGEYRWERALLAIGDYLLPHGNSGNFSFLVNSHRDLSWKRLLQGGIKPGDLYEVRRGYIKNLLDQIDLGAGIRSSLDSVIGQANQMPVWYWRRLIAQNPQIIDFCSKRMIRWLSEDRVYLLRGIRRSGEHAELFSYFLYLELLSEKHDNGTLAPFDKLDYYKPHTDSEEPHAYLDYACADSIISLDVSNSNGEFELKLFSRNRTLAGKLRDALTTKAGFADNAGKGISRLVDRLKIENAIDAVTRSVREFANEPAE